MQMSWYLGDMNAMDCLFLTQDASSIDTNNKLFCFRHCTLISHYFLTGGELIHLVCPLNQNNSHPALIFAAEVHRITDPLTDRHFGKRHTQRGGERKTQRGKKNKKGEKIGEKRRKRKKKEEKENNSVRERARPDSE